MGNNINKFKLERYKKCLNLDVLDLEESDLYFRDLKHNSVGFDTGSKDVAIEFFIKKFGLSNKGRFKTKFNESISGDGGELSKNDALHSSSLCALLCFYNIDENHPLVYKDITYDDVHFEFKNKVIKNPSNMDVVLIGKDKGGKSAIMFVECKFSEFINAGKYKLGDSYSKEPNKHIFDKFEYDKQTVFQYGLKQLVAHYIGIRNFINEDLNNYKDSMSKYYEARDDRLKLYRKFDIVSFIEVIFEFPNNRDYLTYRKETKSVFKALEAEKLKDNLDINLLGTITYQELFKGMNSSVLDEKVKAFYKLN